nr:Chain B, Retinoblastoma-binding protein 5 [Homo sapiens]
EDEEVDVTSVY